MEFTVFFEILIIYVELSLKYNIKSKIGYENMGYYFTNLAATGLSGGA
jgi:hypothetical protein